MPSLLSASATPKIGPASLRHSCASAAAQFRKSPARAHLESIVFAGVWAFAMRPINNGQFSRKEAVCPSGLIQMASMPATSMDCVAGRTNSSCSASLRRRGSLPMCSPTRRFSLGSCRAIGTPSWPDSRILLADGPEALKALDPPRAEYSSFITHYSSFDALDRLEKDIAALLEVMPLGGGSNNWVIAPSRTTTGRPILCNDPHLAAQLPAPWYLVSIRTPDWAVAGASFVGSPAVPCGHNGFAAWGVTAGLTDNTDLFLEELRREGDDWQYRQGDRWLPCGVRREEIRIKSAAPSR